MLCEGQWKAMRLGASVPHVYEVPDGLVSTKCLMAATLGFLTWISLALPQLLLLWAQPLSQPQGTTLGPSRQLGALRPAFPAHLLGKQSACICVITE